MTGVLMLNVDFSPKPRNVSVVLVEFSKAVVKIENDER